MFVVFLFLLFLLWYSVVEVEVESGDVHVQALVFIKIVLVIVINNTTAFDTVTRYQDRVSPTPIPVS